ncbi:MAG: TAXI family TRAP transporter solute-binding subunit [Desulfobacterales bacterium]|nr:TAXI family TRAP transporter solute-binding subunit [Desulfobacterales bacterium]
MTHAKRNTFKQFLAALVLLTITFCFAIPATAAKADRSYLLTTASTGGTFYPVGVALSTLIKVKLQPKHKIGMSAINSAGSGENVKLLRENEAQFGILQGLYGYWAWKGIGAVKSDGPQTNMRSITMLWQNVEQFTMLAKYAKTGTIQDLAGLKGEHLALGKKNSGTLGSNTFLLSNLGLNPAADFKLVHVGYGPSADALQNGQVVAMSTPAGVPTGAVTRAVATMGDKLTFLNFTDEQMAKADGGLNLWTRFVIPAGTYPKQTADIKTIAQPNFLAVRADVDEEAVYLITKTIYENLPFLTAIHKATKAMSLEKSIKGLPMPLHPGALRYYKEAGLTVPERLVAK